ncbi:MAG: aspartyl beta-hydroxylase [Caulobacteraceae bacterium]|nr:aspartyl beta-hydroxylase [Caulobacteraceae bacterium]
MLAPDAMSRLRAALLADEVAQQRLGAIHEPRAFCAQAAAFAESQGLALAAEDLLGALHPDPLDAAARRARPGADRAWPGRSWLPAQVVPAANGALQVDWAWFGPRPITDSFFEISARQAMARPLSRLIRYRTPLPDFLENAEPQDALAPSGLIFHMSRCGSTLAARMLASDPAAVVLSEPPPLDAMVRLTEIWPDIAPARQARFIAAMASALGRRRAGDERSYVIKPDSWHILALPLFRLAFPDTPWVFLYRDPAQVLVSHIRQRGLQTVPGALPPALFAPTEGRLPAEAHCAEVLTRICDAAAQGYDQGGGRLINYTALPGAVEAQILPHFAMPLGDAARLAAAARIDAKTPHQTFTPDTPAKRTAATPAILTAAGGALGRAYEALESRRI